MYKHRYVLFHLAAAGLAVAAAAGGFAASARNSLGLTERNLHM